MSTYVLIGTVYVDEVRQAVALLWAGCSTDDGTLVMSSYVLIGTVYVDEGRQAVAPMWASCSTAVGRL